MSENASSNKAERNAYVAFLRGINVGGRSLIKMTDLRKVFAKIGFTNVRTMLASGNVVFSSAQMDEKAIVDEIRLGLKKTLKNDIGVALRSLDELKKLRSADPFKGIAVTPSIRLYVTFMAEKAKPRTISVPYATPQGEFRILQATPLEVFSVLDLAKGKGTPEAMNIIEKEFGSDVTTRNWNTVLKVLQ
jgi:uncharacterized protein (DUF1697 family)